MPYILIAASASALAAVFFRATLKMQEAAAETPRIIAVLLVCLAAAMLVDVYLYKRRGAVAAGEDAAAAPHLAPFFQGIHVLRVFVFVTAIILYVVLLEPVGYFIVTPLFIFGAFLFLRACRAWVAAIVAAAVPVFIYFLFVAFLDLPVPMGVLE